MITFGKTFMCILLLFWVAVAGTLIGSAIAVYLFMEFS